MNVKKWANKLEENISGEVQNFRVMDDLVCFDKHRQCWEPTEAQQEECMRNTMATAKNQLKKMEATIRKDEGVNVFADVDEDDINGLVFLNMCFDAEKKLPNINKATKLVKKYFSPL